MKNRVVLALALTAMSWPAVCFSQHVPADPGAGEQFLWPIDGWVATSDTYQSGQPHNGTADLSAPHYTPVRPARSGTVTKVAYTNNGGWSVTISHPGTGYTYTTSYTHFIEQPAVQVNDVVDATVGGGTVIGYVGRVGNADLGGPHVHFSIRRTPDGSTTSELMSIPAINRGDWIKNGKFIPGVFSGLSPLATEASRTFEVIVSEPQGASIYSSSALSTITGSVAYGTDLEVIDSLAGAYKVMLPDNSLGWITHSSTVPSRSNIFGVTSTSDISIRKGPSTIHPEIGVVAAGTVLTGFDLSGSDWYKVQWWCNGTSNRSSDPSDNASDVGGCSNGYYGNKYGWVGAPATLTDKFRVRVIRGSISVYANQVVAGEDMRDLSTVIGTLGVGSGITVTGTRNGWYKFQFSGQIGWIRGWQTAGSQ